MAFSAGGRFTAVCTADGELYTFGVSGTGQCGHGGDINVALDGWMGVPRLVEALRGINVVGVSCGFQHTLILTNTGDVWSCGNGSENQLGHGGQDDEHVPRRVEALKSVRIVGVEAADYHWMGYHSVAWSDAGVVYTWGWGWYGRG